MLKSRNDIIFISALLLVVSLAAAALFLLSPHGDTVVVTIDGRPSGEYPLDENRTIEIKSQDGYNILVIKDGFAGVAEASCPDGICSSHRPIDRSGESIICLPNKVVVEVRSTNKNQPDTDIIN